MTQSQPPILPLFTQSSQPPPLLPLLTQSSQSLLPETDLIIKKRKNGK